MQKAHCDNCDALIVEAHTRRQVTAQPWGYQCVVDVTIAKPNGGHTQELCSDCLREALLAFVASLPASRIAERAK